MNLKQCIASILGLIVFLVFVIWFIFCAISLKEGYANTLEQIDVERLADAIYIAEGGEKASKPYGIMSVPCHSEPECRKICINTIRNNITRYNEYGYKSYANYLEFLWHRYAPPEAHPLNVNWGSNVRYYYEKKKGK